MKVILVITVLLLNGHFETTHERMTSLNECNRVLSERYELAKIEQMASEPDAKKFFTGYCEVK